MARLAGRLRCGVYGSLGILALTGALLLAGPTVHAVHAQEESEAVEEESAPPAIPLEAPYDGRLVRLSEIVGSVHAISQLCDERDKDGAEWRRMMEELIAAETGDSRRRARLTAAFNRGYRSFDALYTQCTSSARAALGRYRSEGATLASEIIARFGN